MKWPIYHKYQVYAQWDVKHDQNANILDEIIAKINEIAIQSLHGEIRNQNLEYFYEILTLLGNKLYRNEAISDDYYHLQVAK